MRLILATILIITVIIASCASKRSAQQGTQQEKETQQEKGKQVTWRNGSDTYTIYESSRNVYRVETEKLVLLNKATKETASAIFKLAGSPGFKAAAAEHIADDTPKYFIEFVNGTEVLRVRLNEESNAEEIEELLNKLMSVV